MKRQAKKYGRRYPWQEWFNKGRFVLRRGVHFDESVRTYTMAQMIRNVAPSYGVRVSIKIAEDGESIKVVIMPIRNARYIKSLL